MRGRLTSRKTAGLLALWASGVNTALLLFEKVPKTLFVHQVEAANNVMLQFQIESANDK
jgi:hypothetical protein